MACSVSSRPASSPAGRYLNQDRQADLAFTPHQIGQMIRFFSRDDLQWRHHAKSDQELPAIGSDPQALQFADSTMRFIRSTGAVHLCPLLPQSVGIHCPGSIFQGVALSRRHGDLRGHIGRSPACRRCTEPGLERYALIHEGWTYLGILLRNGAAHRFVSSFHAHMGLNHYYDV